ncbi:M15 family metallopeptidase [Enterovibrio nigricans]|uniref:LD-carboxypeptidase LdcB, LAS superfamily n=1 Tax=Enterovibrio nigricans DSM 22720 TaxID=1121868 RepID=A0A1T4UNM4_9GAMM|nr:M15 family metallopeptidase [Enterovibrio nigricans]SKA54236.1 LD-carboxypeptidase LdcB, LAS superfamily [Enterovibrio nigricans DSM 22720]
MNVTTEQLTGQSQDHLVNLDDRLLHRDIKDDFLNMQTAAKAAGFDLTIASSFRDFDRQSLIWNNKFNGTRPVLDDKGNALDVTLLSDEEKVKAILRWSALPGASRHHWGTDMDVYASNLLPTNVELQLEPWEYLSGHQAPFYQWLVANMCEFGFYLPYQEDKGGVAVEPWHISHVATATDLLKALSPQQLKTAIAFSDIAGRETVLAMLDWIYSQYVSNVCEA